MPEEMTALENVPQFQMSLVVKPSGAKETEDAMHIPNQLPEVMEELDIHVGLLEEVPEPPELQELEEEDGVVTTSDQTPKSHSTEVAPDSQPTTISKIHTQHQMLGVMDQSSPIQEKVLVNGGWSHSIETMLSAESEFSTEETAVETDLPEPRLWLEINSVDLYKMEPEMVNGTQSNAQDQ
jgi:hypothetical protein